MSNIFSDILFWTSIIFIVAGIVLFKLVDRSCAKQKKRFEEPHKNFEKLIHSRGVLIVRGSKREFDAFGRIAPVFITAIGIIMLIVTIIKY